MDHASGDVTAHLNGVLEGLDGQPGLHPRVDRVPHDPVRVHVLDRAEVELSFTRFVLRDVRELQLVGAICGEHVSCPAVLVGHRAEVVVDRRTGPTPLAPPGLAERTEPAVG